MKLSATTRSTGPPAELPVVAAASTPVPGARRGEDCAGLHVRVEERRGKVVPVVEWVGTCAVPRDFTAAHRLLARRASVRGIAQQGAVFDDLRGDVPRRGYDSRNRWRRHRGDAGVVIARAEREEGDDECEGAAKSALHGMILLVSV